MLNFTVGPVQSEEDVLFVGGEQVPYFRTPEFSELMLQNERLMKECAGADENARALFITGSGTAAMEASVMNVFDARDRVLVVNGGTFGQRFVDLCQIHQIPFQEIKLEFGQTLTEENLIPFDGKSFTGFLINIHETSTGTLYDLNLVSRFCQKNNLFLVVDAISSFLADPFHMNQNHVDVMIAGSQKGLACAPGISVIVLSERAVERVMRKNVCSLYFDLKLALKEGGRGQTPFTPAVGILRQINRRLTKIEQEGGVSVEIKKVSALAQDFRNKIQLLPFEIVSPSLSNAVTPLHPKLGSAYDLFLQLKDQYGIWVCPNGGVLKEKIFRVGHIGALSPEDNSKLVEALTKVTVQ